MNDYTMTPDIVKESLVTLWGNVALFIPRFIAALVVFLIGWIIAIALGKVAWHIVKVLQLDRGLESVGFKRVWEKSGQRLDSPYFFYELVKWFFIVVFLMAATNILGLTQVTDFLSRVVEYIPHVFVAAIILIAGVLVARFVSQAIRSSTKAASLGSSEYLASVAQWSVMIFSVLIALDQLQVGSDIIHIALTGIVAAGALALGLSFGLGGKSHAEEVIAKLRKRHQD